ncbi:MAG: hypothetical protein K2L93_00485, partial [Muribaculaceae bacterium]|nr:hypothetical protein [Muribaculaceae bacterium]
MESNQNSDTLRLKALELMGKLPRLIDNIQDEETSLELGQFLKCLANFVAMLEGEQDAYPHLTPERHDEQAAIADNAEYEEAEDAAPDPQACSEVDDDPTTDPPLIDDDPDTDPPMLDDDPDTDIDDAFVSEEEDEAEVGDTISEYTRRRSGRPMINLFTLNDRYRFRRELFGNLDAAMAEA